MTLTELAGTAKEFLTPETAPPRGNAEGPVMGGINLAVYQVELIPSGILSYVEAVLRCRQGEQVSGGSSAETHAGQE